MRCVKRLTCMGCGEVQRIEIVDGVEPPCPGCGPTTWMALPRIEVCTCNCHRIFAVLKVMGWPSSPPGTLCYQCGQPPTTE